MRNLIASWRYSGMPGFTMDPPGPPLRNASRNIRRARIAVRPTRCTAVMTDDTHTHEHRI
eukprot:scaffold25065_cov129-Isochrysis_galbana.AAC.1